MTIPGCRRKRAPHQDWSPRDHVTANLGVAGAFLAHSGRDELDRFMLREQALEIVDRYRPLIAGGLYAPADAATRAALELVDPRSGS